MKKVIKYFGYLFFLPFWYLQLLLPRSNKIWIFGAWYGERYSDNSRCLYDYVRQNQPEIRAIWLSRKKSIVERVRSANGEAYRIGSLWSIFFSLYANKFIVSSGKRDIDYLFINGGIKIQLWHGNPMKKICLDDKLSSVHSFFHRNIVRFFFPFAYEYNYNFIVSNSPIFTPIMASAFGVNRDSILETGCPRNDVFFETGHDSYNAQLRLRFPGCKVIYYLPTFRKLNGPSSLFNLPDYDSDTFDSFLDKNNMVFISKGHYIDSQLARKPLKSNSRLIQLKDDEVEDINILLKDADLLVTDYSGAYFDFLLKEKPIIFAAFDIEEYVTSSRELYFDYKSIAAGPIVSNWSALMNALVVIWENHDYIFQVKSMNKVFNYFHDANNSKRVTEEIKKIT